MFAMCAVKSSGRETLKYDANKYFLSQFPSFGFESDDHEFLVETNVKRRHPFERNEHFNTNKTSGKYPWLGQVSVIEDDRKKNSHFCDELKRVHSAWKAESCYFTKC